MPWVPKRHLDQSGTQDGSAKVFVPRLQCSMLIGWYISTICAATVQYSLSALQVQSIGKSRESLSEARPSKEYTLSLGSVACSGWKVYSKSNNDKRLCWEMTLLRVCSNVTKHSPSELGSSGQLGSKNDGSDRLITSWTTLGKIYHSLISRRPHIRRSSFLSRNS